MTLARPPDSLVMPSRGGWEAAVPRCPTVATGTLPNVSFACLQPLRSLTHMETWTCPNCGPVLSWTEAGVRMRRAAGMMVIDDAT